MLKVDKIDVYYGKVQALFKVTLEVGENEIVSIIGANGAVKTTLMKSIMGINKPKNGVIEYNGKIISGLPSHKVVRNKIVYVPEGREIFPNMTVAENLEMGAYSIKMSKKQMEEHLEEQYELFQRACKAKSWINVGWRTADACNCKRVNVRSRIVNVG